MKRALSIANMLTMPSTLAATFCRPLAERWSALLPFGQAGIRAQSATSLSGRASLVIRGAGDKPIGIETGSSYLSALAIFGYDAGEPDRRKQVIDLKGNGSIVANGSITTNGTIYGKLIKSTRNTGYAFEAKPDDIATTALIRANGSADFTNKLTLLKADTTSHSGFTIKGTVSDGTEEPSASHTTIPMQL